MNILFTAKGKNRIPYELAVSGHMMGVRWQDGNGEWLGWRQSMVNCDPAWIRLEYGRAAFANEKAIEKIQRAMQDYLLSE